ncbi:MAG: hypothetical protein A07HR60_02350 [uncultured archaeon A07HR60]|nr:MAG: hypothetical protein A07HR60_02350 [uncultured archaeon A07HR60]
MILILPFPRIGGDTLKTTQSPGGERFFMKKSDFGTNCSASSASASNRVLPG